MCGIAGFTLSAKDWAQFDTDEICKILGWAIEHRGEDATGVLHVNTNGQIKIRRDDVRATEFFWKYRGIGVAAKTALIHTRFATQGHQSNPLNNHPVSFGNFHVVHNGHINNDYELFNKYSWERKGKVDSEAIPASLWEDQDDCVKSLERLEGNMAVGWINSQDPHRLWVAKGIGQPLVIGMTKGGSMFFASERSALFDLIKFDVVDDDEFKEIFDAKQGDIYGYAAVDGDLVHKTFQPSYGPISYGSYASKAVVTKIGSKATTTLPCLSDFRQGDPVERFGRFGRVIETDELTGTVLVSWLPSAEKPGFINLVTQERFDKEAENIRNDILDATMPRYFTSDEKHWEADADALVNPEDDPRRWDWYDVEEADESDDDGYREMNPMANALQSIADAMAAEHSTDVERWIEVHNSIGF